MLSLIKATPSFWFVRLGVREVLLSQSGPVLRVDLVVRLFLVTRCGKSSWLLLAYNPLSSGTHELGRTTESIPQTPGWRQPHVAEPQSLQALLSFEEGEGEE
jgi:hypothetical protein